MHPEGQLAEFLTRKHPLGPAESERLVDASAEVFNQLYDATNRVHQSTRTDNPSYIVGRKGSGKTAFLVGGAIVEGADVVFLKSEHIYSEVNRLSKRWAAENGPLVADSLVHVWEVLLYHAAMWGIATSTVLPPSEERRRVWAYMSAFGNPSEWRADQLLARVAARMTESLLAAPQELAFREACWRLDLGRGSFEDAVQQARLVLGDTGALYVVVDNLEDLHTHLQDFAEVITGLFRVVSRARDTKQAATLPFRTRFAFPAELLPRLRHLTANPEKDFRDHVIVRWSAGELVVIAGNRLRTFLDLHLDTAWKSLGLPRRHDPEDREAARRTLLAVLPDEPVINGFGQAEEPIAYIMRHTQLLPRHLIQILNQIIGTSLAGLEDGVLPTIRPEAVKAGVHTAEHVIVEGILSTYVHEFPALGDTLRYIKNHAKVALPAKQLHHDFNRSGATRAGMTYDEFVDACLSVGALGIVTSDVAGDRYVKGEFSYTFAEDVRPVEDKDWVCVHPLFMYRWFDRSVIREMNEQGVRAVYPFGSDTDDSAF